VADAVVCMASRGVAVSKIASVIEDMRARHMQRQRLLYQVQAQACAAQPLLGKGNLMPQVRELLHAGCKLMTPLLCIAMQEFPSDDTWQAGLTEQYASNTVHALCEDVATYSCDYMSSLGGRCLALDAGVPLKTAPAAAPLTRVIEWLHAGMKNGPKVRANRQSVFAAAHTVMNGDKQVWLAPSTLVYQHMAPFCHMQVIAQYMGSASTLDLLCGLMDLRMRFEKMDPPAGGGHHGQVRVAVRLDAFLGACLLLSLQPALLRLHTGVVRGQCAFAPEGHHLGHEGSCGCWLGPCGLRHQGRCLAHGRPYEGHAHSRPCYAGRLHPGGWWTHMSAGTLSADTHVFLHPLLLCRTCGPCSWWTTRQTWRHGQLPSGAWV
jgi:hypothetical protein